MYDVSLVCHLYSTTFATHLLVATQSHQIYITETDTTATDTKGIQPHYLAPPRRPDPVHDYYSLCQAARLARPRLGTLIPNKQ